MNRRHTPKRFPARHGVDSPEIGSSFEIVQDKYLVAGTSRPFPWVETSDMYYVESGRQALALVEAELRAQGHSRIHVPSYLCDSMIHPFQSAGWTLTELPVDDDLVIRPADLISRVTTGVLLHAPYFGRQDSPEMLDALAILRRRGVVVVADETHRVFSGPSSVADIRVASLRKSLPLFDGAYVTGVSDRLSPGVQTAPSKAALLRERAMRVKTDALSSGAGNKAHLELFARAERATEARTQPAPMSADSLALLHRLDLKLIGTTRRMNSITLTRALGHSDRFRVINSPDENLLPFYVVLETVDAAGLQHYLVGHRIYCPIHWPPSELLTRTGTWPTCYLSLPIDHRYDEKDMLRMADCINVYFALDAGNSAPSSSCCLGLWIL